MEKKVKLVIGISLRFLMCVMKTFSVQNRKFICFLKFYENIFYYLWIIYNSQY